MARKPPDLERKLILARDQRRKYGSRLTFQVLRSAFIGELENVTLLLADGALATISPGRTAASEGGKRYEIEIVGFPTASEAEAAGMQLAQALLLCAVSLNFGLRLSYHSHEPPTVFDRTVSVGGFGVMNAYSSYSQEAVLSEFYRAMTTPVKDRRLLLSMELFAAAELESNDRARFVMAVSALEPLAEQLSMGPEVSSAVDVLCQKFDADFSVPLELRQSVRDRLLHLKRESIRQALKRLCSKWFSGDKRAWSDIDRAYGLRSELLHEGRPMDLDVLLVDETRNVTKYLRRIYQYEYEYNFLASVGV